MSNDGVGILALLLVVIIFSLPKSNETYTVYRLSCPDYDVEGPSCPSKRYPSKMQYRAIPESQIVVSDTVWKYKNCEVFDSKNWQCETATQLITMRNGDYFESPALKAYPNHEAYKEASEESLNSSFRNPQVYKWFWHCFRIYAFFRDLF